MEFKIEKQESKPLVEREEVILRITKTEATPSNDQVQEIIGKLLKKPKELVVVKNIYQKFGMSEAIASAYVYNSEEALKKFEPKTKKGKEVKKEEKTEEKVEEKPEKKEEKVEEKEEKKEEKVEKKEVKTEEKKEEKGAE